MNSDRQKGKRQILKFGIIGHIDFRSRCGLQRAGAGRLQTKSCHFQGAPVIHRQCNQGRKGQEATYQVRCRGGVHQDVR